MFFFGQLVKRPCLEFLIVNPSQIQYLYSNTVSRNQMWEKGRAGSHLKGHVCCIVHAENESVYHV